MNIKLTIAYDGCNFFGYQKVHNKRTVEGELLQALNILLKEKIILQAASRTDKGVHALGQVVNFITSNEALDLQQLQKALNAILEKDLRVLAIEKEVLNFHPTLDALAKEYHYFICNHPFLPPHKRAYCWHYPYIQLNLSAMQRGAQLLEGEKDFVAFSAEKVENGIRRIIYLQITEEDENLIKIKIIGNRFLYKMVRIIAGTLTEIGARKISEKELLDIIERKNRSLAGPTAPAKGLFLVTVFYKGFSI